MKESRRLRWVGPGLIALAVAGSIASVTAGAATRAWVTQACTENPNVGKPEARWREPIDLAEVALQPWYRLDARLDKEGALEGQRLSFGLDGDRSSRFIDLPPESFGAGPFGSTVLIGADDGSVSRLQLLDVARGCATPLAIENAVIRRATVDPTGNTVYEMRVDRFTRADLGIWARPIDGSSPAVPVIEPIAPDERFGPTFATEFAWDEDRRQLVVQSCGELACRTRILGQGTNDLRLVADPGLASMIGLDGTSLISYAACPGLPCAVLAADIETGLQTTLTEASFGAVLSREGGVVRLVHEAPAATGIELRVVSLAGGTPVDLGPVADGLRLQPTPNRTGDATRIPDGLVLLSPDGRLPAAGPRGQVELRQITDGASVQLDEVTR